MNCDCFEFFKSLQSFIPRPRSVRFVSTLCSGWAIYVAPVLLPLHFHPKEDNSHAMSHICFTTTPTVTSMIKDNKHPSDEMCACVTAVGAKTALARTTGA